MALRSSSAFGSIGAQPADLRWQRIRRITPRFSSATYMAMLQQHLDEIVPPNELRAADHEDSHTDAPAICVWRLPGRAVSRACSLGAELSARWHVRVVPCMVSSLRSDGVPDGAPMIAQTRAAARRERARSGRFTCHARTLLAVRQGLRLGDRDGAAGARRGAALAPPPALRLGARSTRYGHCG